MCSKLMELDGVLIISETEESPDYIVKKILQVENLPSPYVYNNSISGYEWKLDTKYYSASIALYSVSENMGFDDAFCDKIQATIFYFDGSKPSSFDNVLSWMPSLKDVASDVQLLICDSCDGDESLKKKILNWCVENQYELIELNSAEESEEDEDAPFSQARGFGRVIEALQANSWSNLTMKDTKPHNPVVQEENDISSNISSASSKPEADKSKKMTVDNEELILEEQLMQKVLAQDDPEGESFEALFARFASMKEKANGLTGESRKKYAEKVAVAFWKAMGGEEDEIAGLDDD